MAKYRRFKYSTGYIGTDVSEVFKFPDDWTEKDIEEIYNEWYEDQRNDSGEIEEITEDDAIEEGFSESYCE